MSTEFFLQSHSEPLSPLAILICLSAGQMFLLDRFFDGTFLTFGIEVLSNHPIAPLHLLLQKHTWIKSFLMLWRQMPISSSNQNCRMFQLNLVIFDGFPSYLVCHMNQVLVVIASFQGKAFIWWQNWDQAGASREAKCCFQFIQFLLLPPLLLFIPIYSWK